MPRWESGSTSSRMKSSIQSSFFWNSGSVSKSQAMAASPPSGSPREIFRIPGTLDPTQAMSNHPLPLSLRSGERRLSERPAAPLAGDEAGGAFHGGAGAQRLQADLHLECGGLVPVERPLLQRREAVVAH